ncbi:MgtC/SapB family protein [Acidiphilium acidophilum]|uniref:MgtC/SapB family protein n=1 Tax=Acidiphilium acidophilum TaxID=76588 RepID=UPI002E8E67AB|nr:MgtC/SapB family protein [Acidiphilium acidophilum]
MMPLTVSFSAIAVRLLLTMAAGAMVGFNRGASGHAAGLRTTILVALAAAVAMIQANILLPVAGKAPDSFGVMDLMRLPLGILTGVGFIGGGVILKKGSLVTGVTTAATLWIVTVIGLCFGGGQLVLGAVATGLAITTLWLLKFFDTRMRREHSAKIVIASGTEDVVEELCGLLRPLGYSARLNERRISSDGLEWTFTVQWFQRETDGAPTTLLGLIDNALKLRSFSAQPSRH